MFNITLRKVGGLWFLKFGRITLSLSVTSPETYAARQAQKALTARIDRMRRIEELCAAALIAELRV
jgi:hypothetical protein